MKKSNEFVLEKCCERKVSIIQKQVYLFFSISTGLIHAIKFCIFFFKFAFLTQALGISQNLKGNKLNLANSEQTPIYVPSAAKVLIFKYSVILFRTVK